MVNRILIRLKVVQQLYAYLLTRTEFKIETAKVSAASDEERFVYDTYIGLLNLIVSLTGHKTAGHKDSALNPKDIDRKLAQSVLGDALAEDSALRDITLKSEGGVRDVLPTVLSALHEEITASAAFREFRRKRKVEIRDEVDLWKVLLRTVVANSQELVRCLRDVPSFSRAGLERAVAMVEATLDSFNDSRMGYDAALRNLDKSLEQAYKLYLSVFVLIVRLTRMRDTQIDNARNKYLATPEEKNPNTRFVDNKFAVALASNKELEKFTSDFGIGWTDDYMLLSSLLKSITESAVYKEYMERSESDWAEDCEFWRNVLKDIVFRSDDFVEALEEESVYWNDDLHIMGTFVLKSIRLDAQNGDISFLPMFKDEEDSRFGAELFELAVSHRAEYLRLIDRYVDKANWEADRVAFMDKVIMVCAITEIVHFPNVPLAVSFNEYIDIANMYSSPRSGQFVNGLLFSVVEHLQRENVIFKR